MKIFKRVLSALLTMVMLVSTMSAALADPSDEMYDAVDLQDAVETVEEDDEYIGEFDEYIVDEPETEDVEAETEYDGAYATLSDEYESLNEQATMLFASRTGRLNYMYSLIVTLTLQMRLSAGSRTSGKVICRLPTRLVCSE
mgnify:CR=1 FL=1